MIYQNLQLPKKDNRPFFYTNFVVTLDGKAQILKNTSAYWPLGSKNDHEVLHILRAHADVLIHGKNLGVEFGKITQTSLAKEEFKNKRQALGKNPNLPYYIMTDHPEDFELSKATIVGSDLQALVKKLERQGFQNVLIEGGPHLLGSFLKENLLDEVFLTITPKIVGNEKDATITLVEGVLFPPNQINLKLISVENIDDEVFLRYSVTHP